MSWFEKIFGGSGGGGGPEVQDPCSRAIDREFSRIRHINQDLVNSVVEAVEHSGLLNGLGAVNQSLSGRSGELNSFRNELVSAIPEVARTWSKTEHDIITKAAIANDVETMMSYEFNEYNEMTKKIEKVKNKELFIQDQLKKKTRTDEEIEQLGDLNKTAAVLGNQAEDLGFSTINVIKTTAARKIAQFSDLLTKQGEELQRSLKDEINNNELSPRGQKMIQSYLEKAQDAEYDLQRSLSDILYSHKLTKQEKMTYLERMYNISRSLNQKQIVLDELRNGGMSPEAAEKAWESNKTFDELLMEQSREDQYQHFFKEAQQQPDLKDVLARQKERLDASERAANVGMDETFRFGDQANQMAKNDAVEQAILDNAMANGGQVNMGALKADITRILGEKIAGPMFADSTNGMVSLSSAISDIPALSDVVDKDFITESVRLNQAVAKDQKEIEELYATLNSELEQDAGMINSKEQAKKLRERQASLIAGLANLEREKKEFKDRLDDHFHAHMKGTSGFSDTNLRNFLMSPDGQAAGRFTGSNALLRDNLDNYTRRHLTASAKNYERKEFYKNRIAELHSKHNFDPNEIESINAGLDQVENLSKRATDVILQKYQPLIESKKNQVGFRSSEIDRINKLRGGALEGAEKRLQSVAKTRELVKNGLATNSQIEDTLKIAREKYGEEAINLLKRDTLAAVQQFVVGEQFLTEEVRNKVGAITDNYQDVIVKATNQAKNHFLSDEVFAKLLDLQTGLDKEMAREEALGKQVFLNEAAKREWSDTAKKLRAAYNELIVSSVKTQAESRQLSEEEREEAAKEAEFHDAYARLEGKPSPYVEGSGSNTGFLNEPYQRENPGPEPQSNAQAPAGVVEQQVTTEATQFGDQGKVPPPNHQAATINTEKGGY